MKNLQLGQTIRRLRGVCGLSQAELGLRTGFDSNTISRFELGTVTPSVDALYKLAVQLDCSVRDFFLDFDDDAQKRAYLFNMICDANSEELNRYVELVSTPVKKA
ncbi:hypothetical protein ALQ37_200060 [Pseudomonas syringae pv. aptata]|uniref:HTH cro/C1-type domain-containing protein n=1 Tax=Pseudomonas syringae pv. aptata TaxID=83167 RepID=A0A0Q0BRQ6_PSEAP|nr:helix-turn-helix transcriptional regulator [Pseudomonas syringae]KPY97947.1 DNA-binding protein [Pseudomonas syringae pv. aptata]RMO65449.1 hypothetical protein ALQ37_200060 [Pseudomonas syringae pv. aptata]